MKRTISSKRLTESRAAKVLIVVALVAGLSIGLAWAAGTAAGPATLVAGLVEPLAGLEHAYDDQAFGIIAAVVAVALALVGAAALWAITLRSRVREKTAALALELGKRSEAQARLQAALLEVDAARLEAQRAPRERSAFIESVSRELRTPLHGILGAIELLDRTHLDENQARTLSMARSSAEQIAGVLSDLLDATGAGKGMPGLRPVEFRYREFASLLESSLRPAIDLALAKTTTGETPIGETPIGETPATVQPAGLLSGAESPGTAARPPSNPAAAGSVRRGRAIIAEDEAINRLYIKRVLETAGWEVAQAIDGEAALAAASTGTVDFILMDVSMPRMDGLEATRRIRALEAGRGTQRIPIIALTAHAYAEDREACSQAGMDGFLSKPFSEQALWAEVEATVAAVRRT